MWWRTGVDFLSCKEMEGDEMPRIARTALDGFVLGDIEKCLDFLPPIF
jgi:hypothetical protein